MRIARVFPIKPDEAEFFGHVAFKAATVGLCIYRLHNKCPRPRFLCINDERHDVGLRCQNVIQRQKVGACISAWAEQPRFAEGEIFRLEIISMQDAVVGNWVIKLQFYANSAKHYLFLKKLVDLFS